MTDCSSMQQFSKIIQKGMIGAERGTRTLTSCSGIPDSKSGASAFRHFRISKCREIYFIKSVELKWYNIFYIPSFKTLTLRMRFTLLFIYFDRSLTTRHHTIELYPLIDIELCQMQFNLLIHAYDLWREDEESNHDEQGHNLPFYH